MPTPLFRGSAGTICLLMAGTCLAGNVFTTGYLTQDDAKENQLAEHGELRVLIEKPLKTKAEIAAQKRSEQQKAQETPQARAAREALETPESRAAREAQEAQEAQQKKQWVKFAFPEGHEGPGDAAVAPFGDQVEYKLNAMNYNLHLGGKHYVPFQLYLAELDSSESPGEANEAKLADPTQGVAIQFPLAWLYRPNDVDAFCAFKEFKGYCIAGVDVTARGVQLSEQNDAGEIKKSLIFGASASLRAAVLFPIFKGNVPGGDQAGHLSASIGARYYYHNTDKQNLLFGEMTTPDGTPIEFKKEFAAFSVESEFDIYDHFKVRLEYFQPLSNKDALDEVFKASIVLATK